MLSYYERSSHYYKFSPTASQYLSSSDISLGGQARTNHPVTIVPTDGVYLLDIHITPADYSMVNASYVAYVDIEMKSDYGYLSAASEYDLTLFTHHHYFQRC